MTGSTPANEAADGWKPSAAQCVRLGEGIADLQKSSFLARGEFDYMINRTKKTATPQGQSDDATTCDGAKAWRVLVPHDAIAQWHGLSGDAIRLLFVIEHHCRDRSFCYPSNPALAKQMGMRDPTGLRRLFRTLEDEGWLQRIADPTRHQRIQIAMLRRIDHDRPVWDSQQAPTVRIEPSPLEGGRTKRPGVRTKAPLPSRTKTSGEGGPKRPGRED